MVFNWFRRQFNDAKEQPEDKLTPPPQVEPEAKPPEQPTSQAPSQQVAEDYLTWAKAAYKNIQARQPQAAQEEESNVASAPSSLAEEQDNKIETEDLSTPVPELVAEKVETPQEAAAEVETQDAAVVLAQVEENLEGVAEAVAVETPEITALDETVTEQPTAAVPFWARDDRQARLERLKATAIEEPEPEVQPVATKVESTTAEEIPGLAFDDGFLWSAEILASQGRRPEDVSIEEITWLKKLRQGLDKTRRNIINQLKAIVGQGPLNQDAVMAIESLLLQADVGIEATDYIINELQKKIREEALPPEAAIAYLKKILRDMLDAPLRESYKPSFAPEKDTFNIWLMTGVNGAGKTTTIGKIAHLAGKSGYKCLIGAADTFRAAAVEQVKIWGDRSGVEVIANPGKNTDPAAVVFDAIAAARSRGTELLLVDTAGRLQNKKNLMEELSKIRRIVDKKAPDATVESLLVLDATLGQNGLRQAQVFSEAAKLSGVVLTKLDGTAKGGVALAVVKQLGLPIRFIGAGEGIEDLRPFSSYEFVEALLSA